MRAGWAPGGFRDNPLALTTSIPPKTWTKTTDRPLRSLGQSVGAWLFARLMGVPVPWQAVRQTNPRTLLAYEHQRLLALAAAGEAVPPVLAFDGQSLTTGDVGTTLEHLLHRIPENDKLPLMCAASADLATFHARGHWHGGAQARNLTWDGQRFARIDFEEPLHPAMPLETVQLYDALQLVMSLARFLAPFGSRAVCDVLLAYQDARMQAAARGSAVAPDLPGFIAHLLPRLRAVQRAAEWVPRLRQSREVVRLHVVLDGMAAFIGTGTQR